MHFSNALDPLRKLRRGAKRALGLDHVVHQGVHLPPERLRYCGAEFRDHERFLASGIAEAQRLVADFDISGDTAILEIGCGPGRLPIGIIAKGIAIAVYDGVDIDGASVDWCQRYVTRYHPKFRFHLVDAQHERYNPDGRPMKEGFRLNAPDDEYDLVYLHSVFANMVPEDVAVYCREFERVLKPNGKVFLTAFIEEHVPDVTVNPDNYLVESSGRLNVARYEKNFFFDIVRAAGLEVAHFEHQGDLGGQSVVHLERSRENSGPKTAEPAVRG